MPRRSYSLPDTESVTRIYTRSCSNAICDPGTTLDGLVWTERIRGAYSASLTPNFTALQKAKKFLPPQPYNRHDYRAKRYGGSATVRNVAHWCSPRGTQTHSHPHVYPPELFSVNSSDDAVGLPSVIPLGNPNWNALLVEAISNTLPELDVLTMAAEAGQTADMVIKARKKAKDLIFEALRGGKHTAKAASTAWLQWRYGWQQLGYDIQNVTKLLKEPIRPKFIEGRAGESYVDSGTISTPVVWDYSWVGPGNRADARIDVNWNVDASYRANVYVQTRYRSLNAFADIPLTIWEKIPYSFVADWFVNIGNLLAAWRVLRTCDVLATSLGTKLRAEATSQFQFTGVAGEHMLSATGGGSVHEIFDGKSRSPGWIPNLIPSLTVKLTNERIADAVALLATRIL